MKTITTISAGTLLLNFKKLTSLVADIDCHLHLGVRFLGQCPDDGRLEPCVREDFCGEGQVRSKHPL